MQLLPGAVPFFTLVTATRNAAATLPRLLASLASQTYRDFELIMQDGASTDGTVAVAEAWRERLPALSLASEPDTGVYDAWNKALPRIRGQWVLFLGADDRLADSRTLELCRGVLQAASPAICYAVGGVDLCDSQDCIVTTMPGHMDRVSFHLPKGYAPFWQNGLFHRRSLFESKRFDSSLNIFGDYDFICRTWSDGRALHIPFVISSITLGGMSNEPSRLVQGRMEALRISQRYFSIRYLPGLIWAVFKACIAWGIYGVLGPAEGIRLLNRLKRARGLAPTWNTRPQTALEAVLLPNPGKQRRLNRGYLYNKTPISLGCAVVDAFLRTLPLRRRPLPAHVRSILLIKPDHLGDMLLTGSIVPLLRQRYPHAALDLVAASWTGELASCLPGIRDVFTVDHWMHNRSPVPIWQKLWRFCVSFCKTLQIVRQRRYDLCLCLRAFGGNLISLGYLSRAAFLAGHGTGGLASLLDAEALWQPGRHETEHFMEVLSLAGITRVPVAELRYPQLLGADPARLEAVKRELDISSDYAVVFPCSGSSARMFSRAYWRRIVQDAPRMLFVLCVSAKERPFAEGIAQGMPNARIAAGRFAFPELTSLLGGASCIHSVDSFGAHLAGASGVPTIVHCRPDGADMDQFRPLGAQVQCLFADEERV